MMRLYTYYRSSASYRVRIALALKGLEVEHIPISLLKGEQQQANYAAINPQMLIPALVTEQGITLTQSLAILEYLEETHPNPPLLPASPEDRARVRALAQAIACDIAPLNNLRVLKYLKHDLCVEEAEKDAWYRHWIATGFAAVEAMLGDGKTGRFCHGDMPGMADACLLPQVYNARRLGCDLALYPRIRRIAETCDALPPFLAAHPENQKDAPENTI